MNLSKQDLAGIIGTAVDEARENSELAAADIVNSVFARAVEQAGSDMAEVNPEVKAAAHSRLHAAAAGADELGDTPDKPMINALIGVGLALLANGEDAETFYSFFIAGKMNNAA